MLWKPQSYLKPTEFDRRVRQPHRNKVWTASVMVVTEFAYLAVAGLTGTWAFVGGVAIALGSFLVAGWLERWWRGFHAVPLQMLDETVVALKQELATRDTEFAKKRKKQALADALTDKKADGVTRILNGGFMSVSGPNSFEDARVAADLWLEDVLDTMEKAGCTKQDLQHVGILQTYDRLGLTPVKKIDDQASMFSARLDRVQDIIDKYAQD